ncbi:hypothetical protein ACVWW2_006507 [Bradyrhizobium sp. LM4.3]
MTAPSDPLFRSLTSTSAGRAVPASAKLAATTVKIANLFIYRPLFEWISRTPDVQRVDILFREARV